MNSSVGAHIWRAAALVFSILAVGCVTGRQVSEEIACGGKGPDKVPGMQRMRTVAALSPFGDGDYWYLTESMTWVSGDRFVVTPKGFVTDFASVPRPLWHILPKWGGYGVAAVIHDYLYWSQHISRRDADLWLLKTMEEMEVGWFHARVIWGAVRLFGGIAWNGNARRRFAQDIACIPEGAFPRDPRERWKEAKARIKKTPGFVAPAPPEPPAKPRSVY